VKANPSMWRHRPGSKISETMAPILPGPALEPRAHPVTGPASEEAAGFRR
jgi:hypothetical protein